MHHVSSCNNSFIIVPDAQQHLSSSSMDEIQKEHEHLMVQVYSFEKKAGSSISTPDFNKVPGLEPARVAQWREAVHQNQHNVLPLTLTRSVTPTSSSVYQLVFRPFEEVLLRKMLPRRIV
jgi:hypothetical protein